MTNVKQLTCTAIVNSARGKKLFKRAIIVNWAPIFIRHILFTSKLCLNKKSNI